MGPPLREDQPMMSNANPPSVDLNPVARLVVSELAAAPAACVAAACRVEGRFVVGLGSAGALSIAPPRACDAHTVFDLASLTKPCVALTLARLVQKQVVSLGTTLGSLAPELAHTASGEVPLELLLCHRAGLDGHRPLYAPLVEGRAVVREEAFEVAAQARREGCEGAAPADGFAPVYSDLGYLLLGLALERVSGLALDALVRRELTEPLGLRLGSARQMRALQGDFDDSVAPTEHVAWRGGSIRGAVHDENAWAVVGDGIAGHAGLFGDALSVNKLGVAVLDALADRSQWLAAEHLAPLLKPRPGGSLRAGFDARSGNNPTSGSRFGEHTFGHLGFTGTSVWIDPDAEMVGVLLTNRVCPTREHVAIRQARPAAYDALADAMRSARALDGGRHSP